MQGTSKSFEHAFMICLVIDMLYMTAQLQNCYDRALPNILILLMKDQDFGKHTILTGILSSHNDIII